MAHAGAQVQGAVQCHTVCRVQYTTCQSMQQGFGVDQSWSEMCRTQCARLYSDSYSHDPGFPYILAAFVGVWEFSLLLKSLSCKGKHCVNTISCMLIPNPHPTWSPGHPFSPVSNLPALLLLAPGPGTINSLILEAIPYSRCQMLMQNGSVYSANGWETMAIGAHVHTRYCKDYEENQPHRLPKTHKTSITTSLTALHP